MAVRPVENGSPVITLVYAPCYHQEVVDRLPWRPRREVWGRPRTCPGCRKRRLVCEIHVTHQQSVL